MELTLEGRALQQIKDKGYAEKYRPLGQPIHLIGAEFSRASRNVSGLKSTKPNDSVKVDDHLKTVSFCAS